MPGLTGKAVGLAEELRAGVQVGEGPDAQTVGGMQLRLEELAADLLYVHQLEEAGCCQQDLPLRHARTQIYTLYWIFFPCRKTLDDIARCFLSARFCLHGKQQDESKFS